MKIIFEEHSDQGPLTFVLNDPSDYIQMFDADGKKHWLRKEDIRRLAQALTEPVKSGPAWLAGLPL